MTHSVFLGIHVLLLFSLSGEERTIGGFDLVYKGKCHLSC